MSSRSLPNTPDHGQIQIIFGPMFSGKTTELMRRLKRFQIANYSCLVIKYAKDVRYDLVGISTHDQQKLPAVSAERLTDLQSEALKHDVVGIDEGQFFPDIVSFCDRMANQGKIVVVAALDGTFQKKGFGDILNLVPLAEHVMKLTAVCMNCYNEASFTKRKGCETQIMFPDSEVARKMTLGRTKVGYLIRHGLGPHFAQLLKERVKKESCFTLLFDESLNDSLQKKQLDVHIRIWENNQVCTLYLSSIFMGHASACDLLGQLLPICQEYGAHKLVQISMDGPNVNWKLHRDLQLVLAKETGKQLLNVGSCGLHIIHNSFRAGHGASKWEVDDFLSSLHYLFNESPARREDFSAITGSHVFPLPFCKHRWLENVKVAQRALAMWPFVVQYVKSVREDKAKLPQNKSFKVIEECVKDALLLPKMPFSRTHDRLDNYWHNGIGHDPELQDLWRDVRLLLTMSHGQAAVERGFSVNKEIMTENKSEDTLIAQRLIYSHISRVEVIGGADKYLAVCRQCFTSPVKSRSPLKNVNSNTETRTENVKAASKNLFVSEGVENLHVH